MKTCQRVFWGQVIVIRYRHRPQSIIFSLLNIIWHFLPIGFDYIPVTSPYYTSIHKSLNNSS